MPEARAEEAAPLIWRSPPARLILIAIPLALTITVLVFNVGPAIRLIAATALLVSFASPVHGLILVAAFAPIGRLVAMVIGAGEFRIGEVLVLAFFAGWLLRTRADRPGPMVPAATAGWLFAATVAGSIASLALKLLAHSGALTAQIDQEVDPAKRLPLVHQAEAIMEQDPPLLPVAWERINEIWYNYVKGLNPAAYFGIFDVVRLDTVWLDKA